MTSLLLLVRNCW